MKELIKLDPKNEKYYLLDIASVHTSKKFKSYLEESKINIVNIYSLGVIQRQIQLKIYFQCLEIIKIDFRLFNFFIKKS